MHVLDCFKVGLCAFRECCSVHGEISSRGAMWVCVCVCVWFVSVGIISTQVAYWQDRTHSHTNTLLQSVRLDCEPRPIRIIILYRMRIVSLARICVRVRVQCVNCVPLAIRVHSNHTLTLTHTLSQRYENRWHLLHSTHRSTVIVWVDISQRRLKQQK